MITALSSRSASSQQWLMAKMQSWTSTPFNSIVSAWATISMMVSALMPHDVALFWCFGRHPLLLWWQRWSIWRCWDPRLGHSSNTMHAANNSSGNSTKWPWCLIAIVLIVFVTVMISCFFWHCWHSMTFAKMPIWKQQWLLDPRCGFGRLSGW